MTTEGLGVQIGEAGGIGGGDPVGGRPAVRTGQAEDGVESRARVVAVEALAGGIGEVPVVEGRLAEPGALEPISRGHEGGHGLSPFGRAHLRRGRVVVHVLGADEPSRRGEPRPLGVDGPERGRGQGLVRQAGQSRVVAAIGGGRGRATVEGELQVDLGVLVNDVLMDEGIGEAGEALAGTGHRHRRFGAMAHHFDQPLRQDARVGGVHPRTPTRTSRNRHGTEGWPVCPICTGWPLPQFGVPQNCHSASLPTRSSEPQN